MIWIAASIGLQLGALVLNPCSFSVGMSGNIGLRCEPVVARPFRSPAFTRGAVAGSYIRSMRPPIKSFMGSVAPL